MAQDFAKGFYRSAEWRKARAIKIASAHHICQRCGKPTRRMIVHHIVRLTPANINDASIALDQNMLEAVCWECHNAIDHDDLDHDNARSFDEDGDYLPPEYSPYQRQKGRI